MGPASYRLLPSCYEKGLGSTSGEGSDTVGAARYSQQQGGEKRRRAVDREGAVAEGLGYKWTYTAVA
jgi:hypothetical protein